MRTQLGLPAILVALLACVMPARAHRDLDPDSNLVMLPGVTITSDGDLPGYPAANAILNAERTPDANGYQVVFANSWQGAAVYDPAARQHLTITFPSPVTIKGIAWNSGGCENGFYGGGVWKATLDGHVVVSNKTITTGGQGGFMHVPYGADPGEQHEIARFNLATGTQLVLEFPVTARGPAYNYSIRDINIEPYVAATALIDRSSMTNKVMCGYQGWFLCPGDGSASWWGWNHWSKQSDYIGPGKYNTDIWPDTREYDASDLFPVSAGTTLTNGGIPYLFSSARQGAVNVHFRWMQENGIDGVFHQVFVGGYNVDPNDDVQRKLDTVLQNVMNASSVYGRVFALEYDISGVSDADIYNKLTGHWTYVCSTFDIKNHPRYLYHNGKPVVVLWGFGFNDSNHPGTTTTANSVITWFKNNGCFVIGGVPGKWRTLDGDSRSGTAWRDVYRSFNGITPWTVGRYSSASEITTWKSRVSADITACNTYSQLYMPTAWPRFGWDNMNGYPCGQSKIAARGGQHLWDQLYAWKSAGAACQFVAMFDEYDESTAIMKLTDNVPIAGCWWTTEGKGEDWYLRLVNWGSKMQRGEISVSQTIPISSATAPDNATILSNTIPTTMNKGQAYNVAVTVRNTGETCWNAEMFKLGGVGDSDPFAAARQLMASGTTVKTNQTYTFNFTMTAPSTPGTYTTDWQMVHEPIRWFGPPLTKTVTVVEPTPAFSNLAASQSITYGTTSVTLSGRVSAAGPIYPASGETITVTINGNVQATTINDSTGDFSFSYNPSTIPYSASPHTIAYSYAGNAFLGSASDTSRTLTVNKHPTTVTLGNLNQIYDGSAKSATHMTAPEGLTVLLTYDGSPNAPTNAGTYQVIGTVNDVNYAGNATNTLTVAQAALTVVADSQSKVYGDVDPALTYVLTSGSLVGNDTFSGALTRVSGENVGPYAIQQGSLTAGGNYTLSFVSADLTIMPANSANAVTSSQNPAPQGSNVVFTATVMPVLPATKTPTGEVQFFANGTASGGPVPLSGGVASINTAFLPPGSNTVTAAYAGDGNFYGCINSLVQVVNVIALPPSAVGMVANDDDTVTVTFQGTPGAQYLVQAVSDLGQSAGWENVSTNTAGPDGRWTFTESVAAHARRFYRATKP